MCGGCVVGRPALHPCCSSSPCMAARSLPCATRAIKDERLAVDSPTQIPKRARHCYSVPGCLHHPGRRRSLDPGLLLLILTTWTTPADILVHVARLNCQATPLPVTRSVHEARCPVESKCTTCPETERLEFHPLPMQRSLAVFQPPPSTFWILANRLPRPLRSHAPPSSLPLCVLGCAMRYRA